MSRAFGRSMVLAVVASLAPLDGCGALTALPISDGGARDLGDAHVCTGVSSPCPSSTLTCICATGHYCLPVRALCISPTAPCVVRTIALSRVESVCGVRCE